MKPQLVLFCCSPDAEAVNRPVQVYTQDASLDMILSFRYFGGTMGTASD